MLLFVLVQCTIVTSFISGCLMTGFWIYEGYVCVCMYVCVCVCLCVGSGHGQYTKRRAVVW